MSALLYAIADGRALEDRQDLRFVGDGPVAVLGREAAEISETPDALREHVHTVSALMRERAVLPVRYGTTVEEAQLERLLAAQREPLLAALERVRGAVEVAVHARIAAALTSEAAPPRSGTEYLQRRRGAGGEHLDARLAPLALIARAVAPAPRGDGERLSYLVDEQRLAEFVEAVRRLDREHPELELVCTGPWPPYSFTGGWV